MKFAYYKEFLGTSLYPEYHFSFTLAEDDVRKVIHKYAYSTEWLTNIFEDFEYTPKDHPNKIGVSLRILQDAFCDKNVDLGTNYDANLVSSSSYWYMVYFLFSCNYD